MASPARALGRAQAALDRGETSEAVRLARVAAELRPGWRQARLWLAAALSEAGDTDEALAALGEPPAGAPRAGVHKLFVGRVLLDAGRYEEAEESFSEGLRIAPDNLHLEGYKALARWALAEDDPPALADPIEAAAWGAGLWGRWLLLTEERFPGGPGTDYPPPPLQAAGPFERLARRRARRLVAAATASAGRGATERARTFLDRAEALWPLSEEAAELRVSLLAKGVDELERRLPDEGDDPDLRLALADALLETGHPAAALRVLEPVPGLVKSIDPGRLAWVAGAALLTGRARLAAGERGQALEPLELAASLLPAEVEPRYFLAVARLLAGDRRGARRAFVAACRMDGSLGRERLRELAAATSLG